MRIIHFRSFFFIFTLIFSGLSFQAKAQEKEEEEEVAVEAVEAIAEVEADADAAIQANNPLASIKTINTHNYYMPALDGMPDETSNTFWLRYAQPAGRFLIRASLPISSVPTANQTNQSGLGDLNAFAAYLAVQKPKTTFGIGPLVALPTATNEALGSGKWQAGLALVIFEVVSKHLQVGGLITWQTSFAGQADRAKTNLMAIQAFGMWQLGGGTYLRSTGVTAFNFESDSYIVPFGLGIGKVLKSNKLVFNMFAEPQFTVLSRGVGQPKIQFLFGINTQF